MKIGKKNVKLDPILVVVSEKLINYAHIVFYVGITDLLALG